MYTEGDVFLQLPPLSAYEQSLVGHWMQVGTAQQTSNGLVSLGWQEIIAWSDKFCKEMHIEMVEHPRHSKRHKRTYTPIVIERCSLLDWELEQIKLLSQEYVSEYGQAYNPSRQCPTEVFIEDVPEDEALDNARKIREAWSMFNPVAE
jgi:hypothetical protein